MLAIVECPWIDSDVTLWKGYQFASNAIYKAKQHIFRAIKRVLHYQIVSDNQFNKR